MDDTIAPAPDAQPWRDGPGGGELWRLILEAFARAES